MNINSIAEQILQLARQDQLDEQTQLGELVQVSELGERVQVSELGERDQRAQLDEPDQLGKQVQLESSGNPALNQLVKNLEYFITLAGDIDRWNLLLEITEPFKQYQQIIFQDGPRILRVAKRNYLLQDEHSVFRSAQVVIGPYSLVKQHEPFDKKMYVDAVQMGGDLEMYPGIAQRTYDLFEIPTTDRAYIKICHRFMGPYRSCTSELTYYDAMVGTKMGGFIGSFNGFKSSYFGHLMTLPFDDIDPFIQWLFSDEIIFPGEKDQNILKNAFKKVKEMLFQPITDEYFSGSKLPIKSKQSLILIMMCLTWLINCRPVAIPKDHWRKISIIQILDHVYKSSYPIIRVYDDLTSKLQLALRLAIAEKHDKDISGFYTAREAARDYGNSQLRPLRYIPSMSEMVLSNPRYATNINKYISAKPPPPK